MTYDVLVYGPLFCDLIFSDLPSMPVLGTEIYARDFAVAVGGSAIVAAALHRLGLRVGLIAELGNDPMSGLMKLLLNDLGLDLRLIREHAHPLPQVTVALSFPHERAFVTRFEQPDTPPDLAAVLRDNPAKHLHISSFLAAFETLDAPLLAHEAGMTVSMDPGWDEAALRDPRLHRMLREVDIFLPNRAEATWMAERDTPSEALAQIAKMMPDGLIVMKDGANGAVAYGYDTYERAPVLSVTPIDTTGAGDAFDAGFLYAFAQKMPLAQCLRYGGVCGALATTALGGATAVPTLQEAEIWLSRLQS